jgi:hypothetical protein
VLSRNRRIANRRALTTSLADVLLDALAFIELNAGVNLDERIATKGMEYLSTRIAELSDEERGDLREAARLRAAAETNPERKAFFAGVPEMFFLNDEVGGS